MHTKLPVAFQTGNIGCRNLHNVCIECSFSGQCHQYSAYEMLESVSRKEHSAHLNPVSKTPRPYCPRLTSTFSVVNSEPNRENTR